MAERRIALNEERAWRLNNYSLSHTAVALRTASRPVTLLESRRSYVEPNTRTIEFYTIVYESHVNIHVIYIRTTVAI